MRTSMNTKVLLVDKNITHDGYLQCDLQFSDDYKDRREIHISDLRTENDDDVKLLDRLSNRLAEIRERKWSWKGRTPFA